MSTHKNKRIRFAFTGFVAIVLLGGTFLAINFAKGYRPNFKEGKISGTGLLSATSYPKTARILLDGQLSSVTDATLNLPPKTYLVRITKDGYSPWQKSLPIKNELVTPTDARLFPALPAITPVTYNGVTDPIISPDNSKILYTTSEGLFVLSINTLANNILGNTQSNQIAEANTLDLTNPQYFWSPDSSQILAVASTSAKLLSARNLNKPKDITDVTAKLPTILTDWEKQLTLTSQNSLKILPEYLTKLLTDNSANIYFSPDQEKLFYEATTNFTLPQNPLEATLPNINSTTQARILEKNHYYVFDTKEGTNYLVNSASPSALIKETLLSVTPTPTATPSTTIKKPLKVASTLDKLNQLAAQTNPLLTGNIAWYSTSRHLVSVFPDKIVITEYDGGNPTTIFQTDVIDNLALPSSDGHRLIILSTLGQKNSPANFFSLDLK